MNVNLHANCKSMTAAPQANAAWLQSLLPIHPTASEIVPRYFGKVSYQYTDVGHYQFKLNTLDPCPQSVTALGSTYDGSLLASFSRTAQGTARNSLVLWHHFDIREHTPDHLRYMRRNSSRRVFRPLPQVLHRPEHQNHDITTIVGLDPLRSRRIVAKSSQIRDVLQSQGMFLTGDMGGNIGLWDANQAAGPVPTSHISESPDEDSNADGDDDNVSHPVSDAYIATIHAPSEKNYPDQITALASTSQSLTSIVAAGMMDGTIDLYDVQTSKQMRHYHGHSKMGRSIRALLFICDDYDYQFAGSKMAAPRFRQVNCFCACHDHASEGNTYECKYCSCGVLGLMHDQDQTHLDNTFASDAGFYDKDKRHTHPQLEGALPHEANNNPKMFRQLNGVELIVSAGWDSAVQVQDLRMPSPSLTINRHVAAVNALAHWKPMSCGGPGLLATAGWDRKIYTWDLRNTTYPVHILEGHKRHISSLGVLPSGELVSCSRDRHMRIWDMETCPVNVSYLDATCGTLVPDGTKLMKNRGHLAQLPVARTVSLDGSVHKRHAVDHFRFPAHPWALRDEYCATTEDSCTGEFEVPEPISSMVILPSGTIITGGRECLQKVAFNGFKGSLMCWDSVPDVTDEMFHSMMHPSKSNDDYVVINIGNSKDRKDLLKKNCFVMPSVHRDVMNRVFSLEPTVEKTMDMEDKTVSDEEQLHLVRERLMKLPNFIVQGQPEYPWLRFKVGMTGDINESCETKLTDIEDCMEMTLEKLIAVSNTQVQSQSQSQSQSQTSSVKTKQ